MKIKFTINQNTAEGVLYNNESAKDFASLLPLNLTLKDYHNTEKVSDLSKRLNTKDIPPGYQPSLGDITYYAPWGNLAIFYKDFRYSEGLVALGKITKGMEYLKQNGNFKITIEKL